MLILFYIYYIEPRRAREKAAARELEQEILRELKAANETLATINLTTWDHFMWVRERS